MAPISCPRPVSGTGFSPALEPAGHGLDLGLLGVEDVVAELGDFGIKFLVPGCVHHGEGLGVVRDHVGRERHVGIVVRGAGGGGGVLALSWLPIVVSDSHQDVLALGCVAMRLCVRDKEICEFFLCLGFHDLVTAMTRETQHWFSIYSDLVGVSRTT